MGRRTRGIRWFLISVLSIAIIFVLCLIFSDHDKRQNEINEEIAYKEHQPIDFEIFEADEDGGFYVIEAIPVHRYWGDAE